MNKLLVKYIVSTYLLFLLFFSAIGAAMVFLKIPVLAEALKIISAWSSTFVFIFMFRKIYPDDDLVAFVKRQFSEKIPVAALLGIILLQVFLFFADISITGSVDNIPLKSSVTASPLLLIGLFFSNLIRGPLGEEIGWRGFVLNELQKQYSPLKSAIIVGAAWGFWHFPLWLVSGYSGIQLAAYSLTFFIGIVSLSVIITVFYNQHRNLVIPIIIHQLFNYFVVIQNGDEMNYITTSIYFIVAVALVLVNYSQLNASKPMI